MVGSDGLSILGSALVAFLLVLGIEALTRRRLASYLVRVALLFVLFTLAGIIVAGLIASWQITVVVLLGSLAVVFLFLNLRELRRT
jgi:Ca2+/Na+ antiporter